MSNAKWLNSLLILPISTSALLLSDDSSKTIIPNQLPIESQLLASSDSNQTLIAEGGPGKGFNDGASWSYYNKGARLLWKNLGGDYFDRNLNSQGSEPWASAVITDTDNIKSITWDITDLLVHLQNKNFINNGIIIKRISGSNAPIIYASKESEDTDNHPYLSVLTVDNDQYNIPILGDTYLDNTTKTITFGQEETIKVSKERNALLWFDSNTLPKKRIKSALLTLTSLKQFTNQNTVHGLFATQTSSDLKQTKKRGISHQFPNDNHTSELTDVLAYTSFDPKEASDNSIIKTVKSYLKSSSHGKNLWFCPTIDALRDKKVQMTTSDKQSHSIIHSMCMMLRHEKGKQNQQGLGNYGHSLAIKVKDFSNKEQLDEIFVRYYLYLGSSFGENVLNQNGKLPGGITGKQTSTNYAAGWGGRKTDGTNGWSARGAYLKQVPLGYNPLGGTTRLATYLYHSDQISQYGDIFAWDLNQHGLIKKNQWYCIEQQLKMNSVDGKNIKGLSGHNDGLLRAWVNGYLVFEKKDIRFTDMDYIGIDAIDLGFYFGGVGNTPHDQIIAIDNLVIAKSYIGPMQE